MANHQVIWVGFAHIKKVGRGKRVGNVEGAEVYIAIRADNADEFRHKAKAVFRENMMQMFSLDDVENEFDVPKDEEFPNPDTVQKIELFMKLAKGKVFAWGRFFPYGEYERTQKKEEQSPDSEEMLANTDNPED